MCGLACGGGGGGIPLEDIQAGKGVSFVRSFVPLIAKQSKPVVRLLVWMSESHERCIVTSLQRLFGG